MTHQQQTVTGLKELSRFLKQLPGTLQRRVLRKALTKATRPLLKAARQEARRVSKTPLTPGYKRTKGKHLYQAMGKRAKTYSKDNTVVVSAGPMWLTGRQGYNVEHGHQKRGGGMTRPRPILRPAWVKTRHECMAIMVREGRAAIEKEAVKLAKKTGLKRK